MPRQRVRYDPGCAGHSEIHGALGSTRVVRVIRQEHRSVSQQPEGREHAKAILAFPPS